MFLSVMALSSEINQHMIFPTQYIKGLLIKIYDYAIWRNAIWRNIGIPILISHIGTKFDFMT